MFTYDATRMFSGFSCNFVIDFDGLRRDYDFAVPPLRDTFAVLITPLPGSSQTHPACWLWSTCESLLCCISTLQSLSPQSNRRIR